VALQKRIIALVPDLLAASRIAEAAKRAGLRVEVIESRSELDALLPSASLLVLDLGIAGSDMAAAVARAQGVPVIAFGRHTDLARIRAAHSVGIDHFYPRGRFLEDVAAILQQALAGASA
jgi:DNA-binding NarL/FixJ family response regulator